MTNKELSKVLKVGKKSREGEDYPLATINRLKETKEIGATGYKREIVITVPLELLEEGNTHVKQYIKDMGIISRDPSYGLPVEVEQTTISNIPLMNFVLTYTDKTDISKIEQFLLGE